MDRFFLNWSNTRN